MAKTETLEMIDSSVRPKSALSSLGGLIASLKLVASVALRWLEGGGEGLAEIRFRGGAFHAALRGGTLPKGASVALLLPTEAVLHFTLQLPKSARAHLAEIIPHQIPSRTPFAAEGARFGFAAPVKSGDGSMIHVKVAVSPRAVIDDMCAAAARSGYSVSEIRVEEGEERITLIGSAPNGHRRSVPALNRWLLRLAAASGLGLVVLMAAGAASWVHSALEIRRLTEASGEIGTLRRELKSLSAEAAFLPRARADSISSLRLLNTIAAALPADAYLETLEISEGVVRVTGYAESGARVLEALDAGGLEAAAFDAPVTEDPATMKERFSIRAMRGEAAQ